MDGCFAFIGGGDHPANHHGKFDFDEKALISGVRLMLTFVIVQDIVHENQLQTGTTYDIIKNQQKHVYLIEEKVGKYEFSIPQYKKIVKKQQPPLKAILKGLTSDGGIICNQTAFQN